MPLKTARKATMVPMMPCLLVTVGRSTSRNDPRLLRESPEIVSASNWLQTPVGKRAGYSFGAVHAGIATAVAIAGYTETAARILAIGDGLLGATFAVVFLYCGKSLLAAIDASLQRNAVPRAESPAGGRDSALLAAKKKVVMVISFFVQQCIMASAFLLFAALSRYGTGAPLVMLCVPFVLPVLWSMVCTQLFTGRSKLRGEGVGLSSRGMMSGSRPANGGESRPVSPSDMVKHIAVSSSTHHQVQVVPIERSTSPC